MPPRRVLLLALLLAPAMIAAQTRSRAGASPALFTDVTAKSRITFLHQSGASPDKRMFETFGSGVAWIDYDNDGYPDLFFVNGAAGSANALYHNNHDGTFTDVTARAGVAATADRTRYKTGVAVGDFDNDGWLDLYVTALGLNTLFRNNGDGTFTDVIRQLIPHTPWSSMGTDIGDFNNDGLIDLMATDMVGSTHFRRNVMMGEATKREWFFEYAEPPQYIRNALYLNTGAGRMMEFACQAGLPNTDWTWGPRIEDFDNDGRQDIFVANGMLRDVQNGDLGMYADRT
jgi:hypothetical protein